MKEKCKRIENIKEVKEQNEESKIFKSLTASKLKLKRTNNIRMLKMQVVTLYHS